MKSMFTYHTRCDVFCFTLFPLTRRPFFLTVFNFSSSLHILISKCFVDTHKRMKEIVKIHDVLRSFSRHHQTSWTFVISFIIFCILLNVLSKLITDSKCIKQILFARLSTCFPVLKLIRVWVATPTCCSLTGILYDSQTLNISSSHFSHVSILSFISHFSVFMSWQYKAAIVKQIVLQEHGDP